MISVLKMQLFIINPYDTCVANIIVNGKQMKITWHVDYSKISRVGTDEMIKLIYWIKGIYGSHMKESRGKKYNYLRMGLELSVDGEVGVTITG